MSYHSFDFLKKIYFVRTGGSPEELKAANLIKEEVERLGGEAHLEAFEVDCSSIEKAELLIDGVEYECAGSGYSGSTSKEGVEGEFIFISNEEDLLMHSLKDKIVLINAKRVPHKYYLKALKDGALGIIVTTGDVYKAKEDVDLDPYLNRDLDYKEGKIPTVMIRMSDAEKILEVLPKRVRLTLIAHDSKAESHNVGRPDRYR